MKVYKKVKTWLFQRRVLEIFLLSLWLLGGFTIFGAEGRTLKQIPFLWTMHYAQKRTLVDGPISDLGRNAVSLIPEKNTVCFVSPATGNEADYYFFKLKYYLYPRKLLMIRAGEEIKEEQLRKADYILFFVAGRLLEDKIEKALRRMPYFNRLHPLTDVGVYRDVARVEQELDARPSFKKIYEDKYSGAHQAIYKVERSSPHAPMVHTKG